MAETLEAMAQALFKKAAVELVIGQAEALAAGW